MVHVGWVRRLVGGLVAALLVTASGTEAGAGGVTWVRVATAVAPEARASTVMAYDAARGEAVLFGGTRGGGEYLRDTWTFAEGEWTDESPERSPAARTGAAMAYDEARQEVVLYGGLTPRGLVGDTWTWDGSTWTRERPATSPPARFGARMGFDPLSGRLILFGGNVFETLLDETWAWDGTTWTELHPSTSPPPRSLAGVELDRMRKQLVLFGGSAGAPGEVYGDTWVWNGSTWVKRRPPVAPEPRDGVGMAWDADLGAVVLFGGTDIESTWYDDTWAWDGTAWTELAPTRHPSARSDLGMASYRGRPLLFGGIAFFDQFHGDTWGFRS